MNIIVSPLSEDNFKFRPDSTLIRFLEDYFVPDYICSLSMAPVFYRKVTRPAKSVSSKFVNRHLGESGWGLLLYPLLDNLITDNREFVASSLDFTSIFPLKCNALNLYLNDKRIFEGSETPQNSSISEKISNISNFCSLKIGDFIAFEMAPKISLSIGDRVSIWDGQEKLFNISIR